MDNYVYIVASLPQLVVRFEGGAFEYAATKAPVMELLSAQDRALVDLMEEGFDEQKVGAEFYAKTAASKNRFLREYFDFDARLRNMKVDYLAKRLGKKGDSYRVALPEADFEEEKRIMAIFENTDFVLREQQIDELKWEKAEDLTRMDYFNMNTILAFLVKAKMVQRWAELDKAKGQEMFQRLVKEIRGTNAELDLSGGGNNS